MKTLKQIYFSRIYGNFISLFSLSLKCWVVNSVGQIWTNPNPAISNYVFFCHPLRSNCVLFLESTIRRFLKIWNNNNDNWLDYSLLCYVQARDYILTQTCLTGELSRLEELNIRVESDSLKITCPDDSPLRAVNVLRCFLVFWINNLYFYSSDNPTLKRKKIFYTAQLDIS